MPIDETLLVAKREIVTIKMNALVKEISKLKVIQANIDTIKMIQDPAFPGDRAKKIQPNDKNLGEQITVKRRQKIYDKIIKDIKILGL